VITTQAELDLSGITRARESYKKLIANSDANSEFLYLNVDDGLGSIEDAVQPGQVFLKEAEG